MYELNAGSQTLSRGLTALSIIGESDTPLTVPELAERLSIHRSMAYRLVNTFEEHGFARRTASGHIELGARLAAIARNVARDLQSAAMPELVRIANDRGVTSILVTYDGEAAVTIASAEPEQFDTRLGQRPGTRHPIDRAAPGRVIRSQLHPESYPPARFEVSHSEVVEGLTAVAVPLRQPDGSPASLAALLLTSEDADIESLADHLATSAMRIAARLG